MIRKLFGAFALVLLLAACSSTPDSSGTAATDGTLTSTEDRAPISRDDIIFDDDLSDTSIPAQDLSSNPGTQEDLIVSVGDRVFFDYDSSSIAGEAAATLEKQAAWLRTYPNTMITIEGHADERGTREYNLALGERRATAVKNYLVSLGIAANRLTTTSFGKERPAVLGSNPAAWKRNRRGVLVVN